DEGDRQDNVDDGQNLQHRAARIADDRCRPATTLQRFSLLEAGLTGRPSKARTSCRSASQATPLPARGLDDRVDELRSDPVLRDITRRARVARTVDVDGGV